METADIEDRVRTIIAAKIRKMPEEIKDDDLLSDLGIESLDIIEVMFSIEEEYDINIPVDAAGLGTGRVGDMMRLVVALIDAKQ